MTTPSTHFDGIIPVSNITLNKSVYNGINKWLVHFMYSFKTLSDPGDFAFFKFRIHFKISGAVISQFSVIFGGVIGYIFCVSFFSAILVYLVYLLEMLVEFIKVGMFIRGFVFKTVKELPVLFWAIDMHFSQFSFISSIVLGYVLI